MDLSVFRQRKNYGYKLSKSIFAGSISKIWKNLGSVIIKNVFQKAWVYPFCNGVIPVEDYKFQAYRQWCNFKENLADTASSTNIVTDEAITAVAPATTTIGEVNPPTLATVRVHVEENPPAPSTASGVNVEENSPAPSIARVNVEEHPPAPSTSRVNVQENLPEPTSRVSVGEVSTPLSPKKRKKFSKSCF